MKITILTKIKRNDDYAITIPIPQIGVDKNKNLWYCLIKGYNTNDEYRREDYDANWNYIHRKNREREHNTNKRISKYQSRVTINNETFHFNKRIVEGKITRNEIIQTIRTPLLKTKIKKDLLGRPSYKILGDQILIAINPKTNRLLTVRRIGEKRFRQYLKNANK